jgi:hypothetical protein
MKRMVLTEKATNPTYRKIVEAESCLQRLGIRISVEGNNLIFSVDDKDFALIDGESEYNTADFPREFDGTRFKLLGDREGVE